MTAKRMEKLYVTQPYYTTPANFFVKKDSPTRTRRTSTGSRSVRSGCTHEQYLKKTLALPGETLTYAVKDPKIVTYASEPPGLEAVAAGKVDAFLCSQPVGAEAIAKGADLRMLETPAFFTYKTGYIDRSRRSPRRRSWRPSTAPSATSRRAASSRRVREVLRDRLCHRGRRVRHGRVDQTVP